MGTPPTRQQPAPPASEVDTLLADERATLQRIFPLPARRPPPRRRKATTLAGALFATVALAVLAINPVYHEETHTSAAQAQRGLRLADGSQLDLDRHSAVTLRWRLRSRDAELHGGRVLFSVSPARWRPFSVTASDCRIVVRGTQFAVSRRVLTDSEMVTVQVAEGHVAVFGSAGGAAELLAGQRLSSWKGHLGLVEPSSPEAATAWRDGLLIFENTPLAAALAEWSALTGRSLRAADGVATLPLSGVFSVDRANDFIALLPEILPLAPRRQPDGSIEFARR